MTGTTHGTFTNAGNIISNAMFFTGKALVNPSDVDIVLHRESFASDAIFFNGMTHNERSLGTALDDVYAAGPGFGGYGPDMQQLFGYLFSLGQGHQADALFAYNELDGAQHAQLQQVTLDILNPFNTFMGARLDDAKMTGGGAVAQDLRQQYALASGIMTDASPGLVRGPSGMSVWARGFGQWTNVDGDPEAPGYSENAGGIYGGFDYAFDPFAIVGIALGWTNNDVNFDTFRDNASVDTFQLGAYGSYMFDTRWYADGTIAGAWHDLSVSRFIDLPPEAGGPRTASSSYNADSFSIAGEFGGIWHADNWMLQPNIGLIYTGVDTDAFIETGPAASIWSSTASTPRRSPRPA